MTSSSHSEFGGSFAERGFACPGSMALSANEPDQTSPFAAEGTAAHELAAKCLSEHDDAKEYVGATFNNHVVDAEMAANVQLYLDAVREQITGDAEFEVERRFYLSHISKELFGTVDAIVYQPSTATLYINDLKYGAGVFVDVLENAQLLYYALGATVTHGNRGVDRVVMMIHQPRIKSEEGVSRVYEVDAMTLLEWGEDLRTAYETAVRARAELNKGLTIDWIAKYLAVGDHCQFCKAAPSCPLLEKHAFEAAGDQFADVIGVTSDELARRLDIADKASMFISAVRKHAFEQAKIGNMPTGYKFVGKVARRKWTDALAARDALMLEPSIPFDDMVVLKTPSQVEKALGKKTYEHLVAAFVDKSSSGVNLVPLSNKKPAVAVDADAQFSDVEFE